MTKPMAPTAGCLGVTSSQRRDVDRRRRRDVDRAAREPPLPAPRARTPIPAPRALGCTKSILDLGDLGVEFSEN